MEGQFTGVRASYIYVSDNNTEYLVTLDKTNGDIPELGLTAADSSDAGLPSLPRRFTKRAVFWEGELNGTQKRKTLTCNSNGSAYADTAQTLTIDGVAGKITGRRGEALTFPNLPAAAS